MPSLKDYNILEIFNKGTQWTGTERQSVIDFICQYKQTNATFRKHTNAQLRGILGGILAEIFGWQRKQPKKLIKDFDEDLDWVQLKREFEKARDNFVKWVSVESANELSKVINKVIEKKIYHNQTDVQQSLQTMANALQQVAAAFQQFAPGQALEPQEIVETSILNSLANWTLPEIIKKPQQTFDLNSVPQIDTDGQSLPIEYSKTPSQPKRLVMPHVEQQQELLPSHKRRLLYIRLINKFAGLVYRYSKNPQEYIRQQIQTSLNEVKNDPNLQLVVNESSEIIMYIENLLQKAPGEVPEYATKVYKILMDQLRAVGQTGELKKTFNNSIKRLIRKG